MQFPRPRQVYRSVRSQLGSIREVYLPPRDIVTSYDFSSGKEVVLLIHGFFQTRNVWETIERRLKNDGFAVMSFGMHGSFSRLNTQPIDALAALLDEKLERLMERFSLEKIHIVGHSKGGIVGRRYIQHFGGAKRVKSLTTLGAPHFGTPVAVAGLALSWFTSNPRELLPNSRIVRALNKAPFPSSIPLVSIDSKSDLLCPHWCSQLRPRVGEISMANVELSGIGHSELTWDPLVYRHVHQSILNASRRQKG